MNMLRPRTSALSPASELENDFMQQSLRIVIHVSSLWARILTSFLLLSALFARSNWTCSLSNPNQCRSLWSLGSIPSEIFAIAACIVSFLSVIIPSKNIHWAVETILTLIVVIFSIIPWAITIEDLAPGETTSWAFSVTVAATAGAIFALVLSFRTHPRTVHSAYYRQAFTSKLSQVLFCTSAFAMGFGAMAILVGISGKSTQTQAGAFTAVAFLGLQFVACILGIWWSLPMSPDWARPGFMIFQSLALFVVCTSFGLLTNQNVLAPVITSATQFHVQGFLLGGFVFSLLAIASNWFDTTGPIRVLTGFHLFVSPHPTFLAIVSSAALGTSFGALNVYVEQENNAGASIVAAKGCFVVSSIICFILLLLVVMFLLRPAVASDYALVMSSRAIWIAVWGVIFGSTVGFATLLIGTGNQVSFAVANAICTVILLLIFVIDFFVFNRTAIFLGRSPKFTVSQTDFDMDKQVRQVRDALAREREALESIRLKAFRAGIDPHSSTTMNLPQQEDAFSSERENFTISPQEIEQV